MAKRPMVALAVATTLCACASVGMRQSEYDTRANAVQLGMSREAFSNIFPEAKARGAKQYANGTVEVLELLIEYYSFFPTGSKHRNEWTGMEGDPMWFYFYNDKLIQYGKPGDWPSEPDTVVELRHR